MIGGQQIRRARARGVVEQAAGADVGAAADVVDQIGDAVLERLDRARNRRTLGVDDAAVVPAAEGLVVAEAEGVAVPEVRELADLEPRLADRQLLAQRRVHLENDLVAGDRIGPQVAVLLAGVGAERVAVPAIDVDLGALGQVDPLQVQANAGRSG